MKKFVALLTIPFFLISCNTDAAKKTTQKTEPLCWKDIRVGELPPEGAYDGIDSLVKKLGADWKQQFDRELQLLDNINWTRIRREIDSLN